VGELQFDLVQSRLLSEYRVETKLERLPYRSALWRVGAAGPEKLTWPTRGALAAQDRDGGTVALFEGPWVEELFREKNPGAEWARSL
jgi:peptide chain release factor 3